MLAELSARGRPGGAALRAGDQAAFEQIKRFPGRDTELIGDGFGTKQQIVGEPFGLLSLMFSVIDIAVSFNRV
jgi:hypothetical protein